MRKGRTGESFRRKAKSSPSFHRDPGLGCDEAKNTSGAWGASFDLIGLSLCYMQSTYALSRIAVRFEQKQESERPLSADYKVGSLSYQEGIHCELRVQSGSLQHFKPYMVQLWIGPRSRMYVVASELSKRMWGNFAHTFPAFVQGLAKLVNANYILLFIFCIIKRIVQPGYQRLNCMHHNLNQDASSSSHAQPIQNQPFSEPNSFNSSLSNYIVH